MRVLIVEDDAELARGIRRALERDGHEATIDENGDATLGLVATWRPDIVLLDVMLPDADGRDIALQIRAASDIPIVFMTGRGAEMDVVAGLSLGADDYVVKPVRMSELLARLRAVARRARGPRERVSRMEYRDVVVEFGKHRVLKGGRELQLSNKEFELLRMLMEARGEVVHRADLASAIWGSSVVVASKTLDVHVSSLRRKLGDDPRRPRYVATVWGVGFRLVDD